MEEMQSRQQSLTGDDNPPSKTENASKKNRSIIAGKRFGRLTATCIVGLDQDGSERWEFSCSCGGPNKQFPAESVLGNGRQSCGCLTRENALRQVEAKKLP